MIERFEVSTLRRARKLQWQTAAQAKSGCDGQIPKVGFMNRLWARTLELAHGN